MPDDHEESSPPSSLPSSPSSSLSSGYIDDLPLPSHLYEPSPPSLTYENHFEDVKCAVHEAFQSDNRESKWYTPWLESFYYRCKIYSTPGRRAMLGSQIELLFLAMNPQSSDTLSETKKHRDEESKPGLPLELFQGIPDDYDEPEISFDTNVTEDSDDESKPQDAAQYRIPDFVGFLSWEFASENNPYVFETVYRPFFIGELKAIGTGKGALLGSDCGAAAKDRATSVIRQAVKQARVQARYAFSEYSQGENRIQFLPAFVVSGIFFRLVLFRRKNIRNPNSEDDLSKETGFLTDVSCLFEYDVEEREPLRFSQDYLRAWEKIAIGWGIKE